MPKTKAAPEPAWWLSVGQLWKLAVTLVALAGLYYGITARIAVLDERIQTLQKTVERQEANITGLEKWMMDWARQTR